MSALTAEGRIHIDRFYRCDIPAHVYQSTFSPNTQWTEEYAQGHEILAYWQSVARKYNVYSLTRFNTKVTGAYWDEAKAQWKVATQDVLSGESSVEYFDFLISAVGRFNEWHLPNYPGIDEYEGHLRHSSNWDAKYVD